MKGIKIMARTKKTEINPIEKVMQDVAQKTKKIEWNGITIEVKNRMTIRELSTFVASATDICFTSSEDYLPEVFEYAISIATLISYTDFNLPESIEEQYDLVAFTDIVAKVVECIEAPEQYASAVDAVKEKIDYRVETDINLVRKQAAELFTSVENMLTKLNDVFGGIESADIQGMVKAFSDGKIDEEKIMKAYLENKK